MTHDRRNRMPSIFLPFDNSYARLPDRFYRAAGADAGGARRAWSG